MKVKRAKSLLLLTLLLITKISFSQQFYRFKAEVSIKDKLADGSYRLTMGNVYFDKIYKKIVYDLHFPKKETIVVQDTTMYKIENGKVTGTIRTVLVPEFTVFNLALTSKLSNYGLQSEEGKAVYKVGKVEKTQKGIVTTWIPAEEQLKKVFGNIQMLKVDKRLDAMVFYDNKGKIVSRQFFKNYINVKGVEFPQEVTMISYATDGKQNLQLTTYKNIKIDQSDEDNMYRYRIPLTKSATVKK